MPEDKVIIDISEFTQFYDNFFFTLDIDGHITSVSESAERILGYSKEEALGKFYGEFVREDWRDRVVEFYRNQFKQKIPFTLTEIPLKKKDGTTVWVEQSTKTLVEPATGKIIGYRTLSRDITKRKIAEEELRNSRNNLIDIINYLPDPTFVINDMGVITAWNQAIEELTGIPKEQMLGKGNREYSIPFYGDRRPLLIDFALQGSENIEDQYSIMKIERDTLIAEIYTPLLREGGVYLWEKAKPLYDSTGKVVGAIETVRDLTERKQAEEALRTITQQVVRHQLALHELSRMPYTDFTEAIRTILATDARTIGVDFVSLWFADTQKNDCYYHHLRFIASTHQFVEDEIKRAVLTNEYLRTLEQERIIAIADIPAHHMSTTIASSPSVAARMDVSIRLGGATIGFVCHEHTSPRSFTIEEQDFVISIADLIALSYETHQRRIIEQALEQQRKFTESLIENSPLATFVIDSTHRVMLWNKACEQLTGIPAAKMIGTDKQWEAFYSQKRPTLADLVLDNAYHLLPQYYRIFYKSVLTSDGWHAEGWYRNLGGVDRYIIFEATPIRNSLGKIIAAVETIQDITDLKLAEENVLRMRSDLKNIIDSMPSIIIGVNREGAIIHFNLEAEKISGIAEEQARGRLFNEVFPSFREIHDLINIAIESKTPQKVERKKIASHDGTRYLDLLVYPLIGKEVEGAVIRIDDISNRVRIEEMMVQTEKMLSVGGLAAGMAHEINNPLGGILMGAQNILRRISPELEANIEAASACGTKIETILKYMEMRKITTMLNGIIEMGERAAKIVSNMLSFSRPSESRMSLENIQELLDKTIELAANDYDLKKKYDFRHIKIIRNYEPNLPTIPCVATEIQQVILNLLKNSAQAIAEKNYINETPTISIRLCRENEFLRIDIEDNGPGIDEHNRKRVFEPFFTTKEVGVGTGLGLSVSYFIITNNHGGTMSVDSTVGKGTTFTIQLPIQRRK
ncbi:MAG: PAS domain S-box protein [Spirochaetes bacterium]|nr:PAS domain S-box protein [Spirochaetota bacterium]